MSKAKQDNKSGKVSPDLDTPTDLPQAGVDKISAALNVLLADAFALYMKTKNFQIIARDIIGYISSPDAVVTMSAQLKKKRPHPTFGMRTSLSCLARSLRPRPVLCADFSVDSNKKGARHSWKNDGRLCPFTVFHAGVISGVVACSHPTPACIPSPRGFVKRSRRGNPHYTS